MSDHGKNDFKSELWKLQNGAWNRIQGIFDFANILKKEKNFSKNQNLRLRL